MATTIIKNNMTRDTLKISPVILEQGYSPSNTGTVNISIHVFTALLIS